MQIALKKKERPLQYKWEMKYVVKYKTKNQTIKSVATRWNNCYILLYMGNMNTVQ